jgi:hypothetical protein
MLNPIESKHLPRITRHEDLSTDPLAQDSLFDKKTYSINRDGDSQSKKSMKVLQTIRELKNRSVLEKDAGLVNTTKRKSNMLSGMFNTPSISVRGASTEVGSNYTSS